MLVPDEDELLQQRRRAMMVSWFFTLFFCTVLVSGGSWVVIWLMLVVFWVISAAQQLEESRAQALQEEEAQAAAAAAQLAARRVPANARVTGHLQGGSIVIPVYQAGVVSHVQPSGEHVPGLALASVPDPQSSAAGAAANASLHVHEEQVATQDQDYEKEYGRASYQERTSSTVAFGGATGHDVHQPLLSEGNERETSNVHEAPTVAVQIGGTGGAAAQPPTTVHSVEKKSKSP